MLTYCKRLRTQDNQWQLSFHSNSGKASLRIHSCTAASPALGGFVQKCVASVLRDDFPFFHFFFSGWWCNSSRCFDCSGGKPAGTSEQWMGEDGVLRNLLQQVVKVCVGEDIRLSLLYTVYLHVYHLHCF